MYVCVCVLVIVLATSDCGFSVFRWSILHSVRSVNVEQSRRRLSIRFVAPRLSKFPLPLKQPWAAVLAVPPANRGITYTDQASQPRLSPCTMPVVPATTWQCNLFHK